MLFVLLYMWIEAGGLRETNSSLNEDSRYCQSNYSFIFVVNCVGKCSVNVFNKRTMQVLLLAFRDCFIS